MKYKIATLGCKVNQYEGKVMADSLEAAGFLPAKDNEQADIIIVNSCTVTAESDRKVRQLLRRMKKDNTGAISVLTGCMPQAFPDDADIIDADIILGTKNRAEIAGNIRSFLSSHQRIISIKPHEKSDTFEKMEISAFSERTRAFLKIQDGCNRFCSYCIIPYARGRSRSKPLNEVANEAEKLANAGYKEIVLTGINLPAYGRDIGAVLADSIEALDKTDGIERIRLGSLEPEKLGNDEIQRLAGIKKLCPQFHLSLQSGCDATLRRMNRHYTSAEYREIVGDLRKYFPNCAITTDVMVGFAGETDEEFAESYAFVREIGFAKAHVFMYSRRAGTSAYDMPGQLSNRMKAERSKKMLSLSADMQRDFFKKQIGLTENVLFEQRISEGIYEGYTPNYTPVRVKAYEDIRGKILQSKITLAGEDFCQAELSLS